MTNEAQGTISDIANHNISARADHAKLTELEGVILGIVWSREPCSPYVVLSRFQKSPTWGWSSSTGAIYPAVRRLIARELITQRNEATGMRKSKLLSLSGDGLAALRDWIAYMGEEMGSAGIDPIRTRVNYLAALSSNERVEFLKRAEDITQSRLKLARETKTDPDAQQNWTLEATTIGLIYQLEARLRWLRAVRKLVGAH